MAHYISKLSFILHTYCWISKWQRWHSSINGLGSSLSVELLIKQGFSFFSVSFFSLCINLQGWGSCNSTAAYCQGVTDSFANADKLTYGKREERLTVTDREIPHPNVLSPSTLPPGCPLGPNFDNHLSWNRHIYIWKNNTASKVWDKCVYWDYICHKLGPGMWCVLGHVQSTKRCPYEMLQSSVCVRKNSTVNTTLVIESLTWHGVRSVLFWAATQRFEQWKNVQCGFRGSPTVKLPQSLTKSSLSWYKYFLYYIPWSNNQSQVSVQSHLATRSMPTATAMWKLISAACICDLIFWGQYPELMSIGKKWNIDW